MSEPLSALNISLWANFVSMGEAAKQYDVTSVTFGTIWTVKGFNLKCTPEHIWYDLVGLITNKAIDN